eukprot:TRINITY_DN6906_c0_g1_i2.p1 TRINITY_DN6906_c0_g1~~TRINITY_DN6906_c0_g1_i2.p1  ORF type:complete len:212 (-),score=48.29 TRINITY_DN6906_c0_g1_i2:36-671(-)
MSGTIYYASSDREGMEQSALHYAINKGSEFVKVLLEAGADPREIYHNDVLEVPCITLAFLSYSDVHKKIKVMKLLLQYGEDIDRKYHFQERVKGKYNSCVATTLHMAVKRDEVETIRFLVMNGADPDIPFKRDNEVIPTLDLCISTEAKTSLNCEFKSIYFPVLHPAVQSYILNLLLIQMHRKIVIPLEVNSIIFTKIILLHNKPVLGVLE